jgi:putative membrane protein
MKRLISLLCVCTAGAAVSAGSAAAATNAHHDCYWRAGRYHDCDGRTAPNRGRTTTHARRSTLVSAWDKQYLQTSLEGDLFEVQGGKLAEAKSTDPAVLKLANTLIRDHTKSYKESAKLTRRLGIKVPTDPSPSMQWELEAAGQFTGAAFNHQYALLEVKDHHQDIQESTDEVKDGTNSDVRRDAKTELPTLRKHLRLAEAALRANP